MVNQYLGYTFRDKITGYTGACTGRAEYISGCHQLLLSGKLKDDGTISQSEWFDEQRLVRDEQVDVIILDNGDTPGHDRQAPKR